MGLLKIGYSMPKYGWLGGWPTGMMKFPIYGKIKNVPNHQPDGYFKVQSNDQQPSTFSGHLFPENKEKPCTAKNNRWSMVGTGNGWYIYICI